MCRDSRRLGKRFVDRHHFGQFLHIVIGYFVQSPGIQVVFYVFTLLLIIVASTAARRSTDAPEGRLGCLTCPGAKQGVYLPDQIG